MSDTKKTEQFAPYGLWQSKITSSFVTSVERVFLELRLDHSKHGQGIVYWLERRPKEKGRGVVCSKGSGGKTVQWTLPEFNVRSSIHEYGGGAFNVYNGVLYFVNSGDNRMYAQKGHSEAPTPITAANTSYRYGDAFVSAKGVYCIREDTSKNPAESALVFIEPEKQSQQIIAQGADFYSSPNVSPNGRTIAWTQWDFPNMPWDTTEIWTASLTNDGAIINGTEKKVLNKPDVSYMQPKFSDDNILYFISDESNWWNLYEYSPNGMHKNLMTVDKEMGGPQWQLGESAYSFDPSGSGDIAVTFDGELNIINRKSDLCYLQETDYFDHSHVHFNLDRSIYCIAADPKKFQAILQCNVVSGEIKVVQRAHDELDSTLISVPESMTFATDGDKEDSNDVVYAYFYSPKNPGFKPLPNTLPPLVVFVHGGPTGRSNRCLDLRVQYYTSRGFAVLNVDYRGSTGYGRKYRNLLKTNYGITDVEDCCNGASVVVEDKKVDPKKLCISGRSAGGYVVLAALAFKNLFSAGVCHYGISDLVNLQKSSCKFELHYFDTLIAPYPEHIEVYRQRSPINHVDEIKSPVAFFHGTNDTIVPVDQIKEIYELLKKKNVRTSLVLFEGEGHGYRMDKNIQIALDGEFDFFCKALNITDEDVKQVQATIDFPVENC